LYETGEWGKVHEIAESIDMDPNILQKGYLDALVKANEII